MEHQNYLNIFEVPVLSCYSCAKGTKKETVEAWNTVHALHLQKLGSRTAGHCFFKKEKLFKPTNVTKSRNGTSQLESCTLPGFIGINVSTCQVQHPVRPPSLTSCTLLCWAFCTVWIEHTHTHIYIYTYTTCSYMCQYEVQHGNTSSFILKHQPGLAVTPKSCW